MKRFRCQACGNDLHFDGQHCFGCGHRLGYLPDQFELMAVEEGNGAWHAYGAPGTGYRFCGNAVIVGCSWLIPDHSSQPYCAACRHNRVVPDPTTFSPGLTSTLARWRETEAAKRRLFYSLIRWGLPLRTWAEDDEKGLGFDFLADAAGTNDGKPILTGHDSGIITINLAEGDEAERTMRRLNMGEPYRTLIGHMRHEIGHYYWERLVRDAGRIDAFRALFGDERIDYAQALDRHYQSGPAPGWEENYISGYAASHPWEDFAETWAHWTHIVDGLETAQAYGLALPDATGGANEGANPYDELEAGKVVERWVPYTIAVNEVNRSMGQPDLYPFVLPPRVIGKLDFICRLIIGR